MLAELSIRDLALIESAELTFTPGLNVVTGETGAGKSLLVGAFECLLGERMKGGANGWVRDGAKRARVEARFLLEEPGVARRVREWLRGHLPELLEEGEPDEIILGRTVGVDGRTRAHVDQRPVALRDLRRLTALLLEIHGQNEHQSLLESSEQRRLVDLFGGLEPRARRYAERRASWLDLAERAEREATERGVRRDRLDLTRFQLQELQTADVEPGEAARLREERGLLRNAQSVQSELGGVVEELFEREGSLVERVRAAEHVLARWIETAPSLEACAEELAGAALHLEEAAGGLTTFVDGVEHDPARLEMVEERLVEIEQLQRKYDLDADQLSEHADELRRRVEALDREEQDASEAGERASAARDELVRSANALTRARRGLRAKLAKSVCDVLGDLGLAKARFELSVEPREPKDAASDLETDRRRFAADGADRIEFLLAANPGEPAGSLARVASGGEAARILLGLQSVLASCDRGRTLVFDEVDAGVGGRLGPAVGRHLREVSRSHQVLVVTHLPAIAALADHHLRVAKSTGRARTSTRIELMEGESRVQEIAEMIAGGGDEETARAEARRLLTQS